MPVAMVRKLDDVVTGSIAGRRFQVLLLASFASMALLLACIGVYGVVSFSVAQKRNEFGIRIALGAKPARYPESRAPRRTQTGAGGPGRGPRIYCVALDQVALIRDYST
jgi:hypothetical protein